jgi:tol-pal system protein YbgF
MRHSTHVLVTTALLVAALLGAAPASAASKEQLQMMADIRMLQEQAQQLQILLGTVSEAIVAVNKRLDEQSEANRKGFADQKLTIDTLGRDVGVVREKVDDTIVRVGSIGQEVEALRQTVETMNAPISFGAEPVDPAAAAAAGAAPGADAAAPAPAPAPVPDAAPAGGPTMVGVSPTRLLNEARSDYSLARWDLAISGFEAYIKSFPRSDEADDAQLSIGNAYLQDGKYDKAVEAYDLVVRNYPKGNAVPEAYYKKGLALQNLQQPDRAREAFEFVRQNYPDSFPANLASQRLQELKKP